MPGSYHECARMRQGSTTEYRPCGVKNRKTIGPNAGYKRYKGEYARLYLQTGKPMTQEQIDAAKMVKKTKHLQQHLRLN